MNIKAIMETNELTAFRYPNKLMYVVDIQKSSSITFQCKQRKETKAVKLNFGLCIYLSYCNGKIIFEALFFNISHRINK